MTPEQAATYHRVLAFDLDDPGASLPFSRRLARDNGWTAGYARRVIDEYKRFAFLAVAAGHPVTPSDQVDQAWHLHLLYTRSYWDDFCAGTLGQRLHHGPTRGGAGERDKFEDWYGRTLQSYARHFGSPPPPDIWPRPELRFGRDVHFVRVNTRQHWVVPKPDPRRWARLLGVLVLALFLVGCASGVLAGVRGPLDLPGEAFLTLFVPLSLGAIALGFALRWLARLPGDGPAEVRPPLDVYEAAYLAGGSRRAVDAAVAQLVAQAVLRVTHSRGRLEPRGEGLGASHPLEMAVVAAAGTDVNMKELRRRAETALAPINGRLRQAGLLVSGVPRLASRWLPLLPIGLVLAFGMTKIGLGLTRGRPVGFLSLLCCALLLAGVWLLLSPPHRSRYGDRVLARIKAKGAHRSTTVEDRITWPLALAGPQILADAGMTSLHNLLVAPKRASGDSGSCGSGCGGDSGGGDSGGGGGCGGCGGGGD